LFHNSGDIQRFDEWQAGPVATRHFRLVDPHFAVIDLQSGQGGHHVFHHFNAGHARTERGAAGCFNAIGDNGFDAGSRRQIAPHEYDSRIGLGRAKLNLHVASAPKAKSIYRDRAADRALLS
jgi:hypothetical protein